jgi:hypothetical protein
VKLAAALALLSCSTVLANGHKTVAVLEYRAGARGATGVGERLARLLAANAALTVIAPSDARRKSGRIDAEVARCSGEAICIGVLGEQLGVQEVLLIGVSQLGDTVLAMQRIDVRKGEAGARLAESLPADTEPTDDEMLGWLRQLFPPDVFKRYGAIKIVTNVAGAAVELNGESQGKTPIAESIKVRAPATYKVRLSKSDYVTFQAGIDVLPDATVEVRATLVREEGKQPWYKKWYVWAAVGGAIAIAGAAVAIYYGTKVDETPMGFINNPRPGGATVTNPQSFRSFSVRW